MLSLFQQNVFVSGDFYTSVDQASSPTCHQPLTVRHNVRPTTVTLVLDGIKPLKTNICSMNQNHLQPIQSSHSFLPTNHNGQ